MKKMILFFVIVFILYLILGTTLPYVHHKEVAKEFKTEFNNMIFTDNSACSDRIAYVADNVKALKYRLWMTEQAEEEIIISTFDFNSDKAGITLMSSLQNAANRGVKIKILVDGISGFLDLRGNEWFLALVSNENIRIKIYNPVNLLKPWGIQVRLHDKYFIVDDKMYLLGGRNTTNLFLGDYSKDKNHDREIFAYTEEKSEDSSLNQVKNYFQKVWELNESKEYICKNEKTKKIVQAYENLETAYDDIKQMYPDVYQKSTNKEKTYVVNKITLLYNPIQAENKEPWLWYALVSMMKTGQEILIHTPYIILSDKMSEDLKAVCEKTENVSIIINDPVSGANPWGCTDYLNQKEDILDTGVRVYEYMGLHSKHSKIVLIDNRISILGSFNFDMRSAYLDTEMMLVIDSKEFNQDLQKETQTDKSYSKSIQSDESYIYGENYKEKKNSALKEISYALLRILIKPVRHLL